MASRALSLYVTLFEVKQTKAQRTLLYFIDQPLSAFFYESVSPFSIMVKLLILTRDHVFSITWQQEAQQG